MKIIQSKQKFEKKINIYKKNLQYNHIYLFSILTS